MAAAIMLGIGFWLRWPTLAYDGPPSQNEFNKYAFAEFSYSDIASLYFRDRLSTHPRPYFDYRLEYPVGTGLLIFLLNTARTLPAYFLLTSTFLAACGLATVALIRRFPVGNVWLVALSPALAFYVNLNWDFWALLLTMAALFAFVRGREALTGLLMAGAVWSKFFPIVFLPLMMLDHVRRGHWKAAMRLGAFFVLASAVINAPLLLLRPSAWLYFFEMNRTRGREVNLWTFFDRWELTVEQINTYSAVLFLAGFAVTAWCLWRGHRAGLLLACCAALAWFFFVNKVYSPQYSLWLVVLLAAAGVAPALAVAWSATDLVYFAASFLILGLVQFGPASSWFYRHALMPAMALREGMLLLLVFYSLWSMRRSTPNVHANEGAVPEILAPRSAKHSSKALAQ